MRFKRDAIYTEVVPSDWHERLLTLWVEDDACRAAGDRTREMSSGVLERISGVVFNLKDRLAVQDNGDFIIHLYRGGWWVGYGPGQDEVGVVVKVTP